MFLFQEALLQHSFLSLPGFVGFLKIYFPRRKHMSRISYYVLQKQTFIKVHCVFTVNRSLHVHLNFRLLKFLTVCF